MSENTVELLIQAKDEASKVVESFSGTLDKLRKKTESTSNSLLKSDKTLAKLNQSYEKLKETASELNSLKRLASQLEKIDNVAKQSSQTFSRYSQDLKAQKAAVNEASEAYSKINEEWLKSKTALDKLTVSSNKDKDAIIKQRDEIRRLAEARKNASSEVKAQESSLRSLSNAYKKASAEKVKSVKALEELSDKANKSGISLSNLGAKTKELDSAIKSTNASMLKSKAAINGHIKSLKSQSVAADKSRKSISFLNRESRVSMSTVQRLRGQILSITAAYVGLYGVVNQTTDAFRSYNEQQGALAKLMSANEGNQSLAGEEMEFVSELADRLGLDLRSLEKSYSSFFVAAKLGGEESQFIQAMFENMAEGAAVNKLTVDQFNGSMTAMIQIMSKGTVMAEELQGQLAERFPGAVELFSKAIGKTSKELRKMMEQGLLTSDQLLGFTVQVSKSVALGLDIASESLLSNFNRLGNQATELKRQFAGLTETGLNEVLSELNDTLSGDGGVKLVESFAAAFTALGKGLIFVIENLETIGDVIKLLISMKIASVILGVASAVMELRKSTGKAGILVGLLVGKLTLLLVAVSAVYEFLSTDGSFKKFSHNAQYYFGIVQLSFSKLKEYLSDPISISLADGKDYFKELGDEIDRLDARLKGVGSAELVMGDVGLDLAAENEANISENDRLNKKALAEEEAKARLRELEDNEQKVVQEKYLKSLMKEFYSLESQYLNKSAITLERQKELINSKYDDLLFNLEAEGRYAEVAILNEAKMFDMQKAISDHKEDSDKRREAREKIIQDAIKAEDKRKLDAIKEQEMLLNISLDTRQARMNEIAALREQGSLDSLIQSNMLEESLGGIDLKSVEIIDKMIEMWDAVGGSRADAAILKLKQIKLEVNVAEKSIINMDSAIKGFSSGAADSLVEFGRGISDSIRGTDSLAGAFKRASDAFSDFASAFIVDMGKMILQRVIFNYVSGILSPTPSSTSVATVAPSLHNGGIAGQATQSRGISANLVKYHSGGIAGLRPNEVMTVLEKGEEVLTEEDPRHRYNKGGSGGTKVQIIDQRGSGAPDIEESQSSSGGMEMITLLIKETVEKSMNNGSLDSAMGQFSSGRRGIMR